MEDTMRTYTEGRVHVYVTTVPARVSSVFRTVRSNSVIAGQVMAEKQAHF